MDISETKKTEESNDSKGAYKSQETPSPKKQRKTKQHNDDAVYIGKRPTMNYVMAAMVILNRGENCTIKARGRAISHAVDVSEILINKFYPTAKYADIKLGTEHLKNDDGKVSNVSSMEIVISPN